MSDPTVATKAADTAYLDAATAASLASFKRRRQRLIALRALLAGLLAWAVGLCLVAVADQLWWLTEPVRWAGSLSAYAAAFGAAWLFGLRQLYDGDLLQLARKIEWTEPRLRNQLLAAVELADPGLTNGSPALRHQLQRRVRQRLGSLQMQRLLPMRLLSGWLWAGAVLLVVCLILGFIPSLQLQRRFMRAAFPGVRIERASLTSITFHKPEPTSRHVAEGDLVAVAVEVGGRPADEVYLHWATESGLSGEFPMQRRSTADEETSTGTGKRFEANLPVDDEPVNYRVEAGDAVSLWHTLSPLPRPRATSFNIRYSYPDYADLPAREVVQDHGDLSAIAGSSANVTVDFDQPIRSAVIRYGGGGGEVAMQPANESNTAYVATLPIDEAALYQVAAVSERSGIGDPFSPQYSVTPIVDQPPIIQWSEETDDAQLVGPLEVIELEGVAKDDMPIAEIHQEFRVNGGVLQRRQLTSTDTAEQSGKSTIEFEWDLVHPTGELDLESHLKSGDRIQTRLVAVDRHEQRAASRVIQLLIADEGFDSARHEALKSEHATIASVVDWAGQMQLVLDELDEMVKRLRSEDRNIDQDALQALSSRFAKSLAAYQRLREQLQQQLRVAEEPLQAEALEHLAQAVSAATLDVQNLMVELDQAALPEMDVSRAPRLEKQHGAQRRRLRQDIAENRKVTRTAESLARGWHGHQLTRAFRRDLAGLQSGLRPAISSDAFITAERLRRYAVVASGRMQEVEQLLSRHSATIFDSTRRHLERWQRFSDTWTAKLEDVADNSSDADEIRDLLTQLLEELEYESALGVVTSRQNQQLTDALVTLRQDLPSIADLIDVLGRSGKLQREAIQQQQAVGDSEIRAAWNRQSELNQRNWERKRERLVESLEIRQSLHRLRQTADLAWAADLNLLRRAIENITDDGFAPHDNTPAEEVFDELVTSAETLRWNHALKFWHRLLEATIETERYSELRVELRLDQPLLISVYDRGIEALLKQIKRVESKVPESLLLSVQAALEGKELVQARDQIKSRQWEETSLVPADHLLVKAEQALDRAVEQAEPLAAEARETIRKYVVSLPDQARRAAEAAESARSAVASRHGDDHETASNLARQQEAVSRQVDITLQSLSDLANNAEMLSESGRELAKDADAAGAAIEQLSRRAEQAMEEAVAATGDPQRAESLDENARSLKELSETLQQTAEHFERAAAGQEVQSSRQQLRDAAANTPATEEQARTQKQVDELSRQAVSDPEELLRKLEAELERNAPMRDELSMITNRAAVAALKAIQRAALEQQSVTTQLEKADPQLLERRRLLQQRLSDLATAAEDVEKTLLATAENAINWSKDPQSRPTLQAARKSLGQAATAFQEFANDDPSLREIEDAVKAFRRQLQDTSATVEKVAKHSRLSQKKKMHESESILARTVDEMEKIARDSRGRRIRAATSRRQFWSNQAKEAGRQLQDYLRQQRDAERRIATSGDATDDAAVAEDLDRLQERAAIYEQAADAARQSRKFAEAQEQEFDAAASGLRTLKISDFQAPNPASQLAADLTETAVTQLRETEKVLVELTGGAELAEELHIPRPQANLLAERQLQIERQVAGAVEKLNRASRHEERLERSKASESLAAAAQALAATASGPINNVRVQITEAAEDADGSPKAHRAAGEAAQLLAEHAESIRSIVEELPANDPANRAVSAARQQAANDGPNDSGESEARDGRRLARTLDELDRSMNTQSSGRSGEGTGDQQPDAGSNASDRSGAGDERQGPGGQRSGGGATTSMEASPTLNQALRQRVQQAARQRQQRLSSDDSEQPIGGESSSSGPAIAAAQGEDLDADSVGRSGAAWGQLRQQTTEQVAGTRSFVVPPQYRQEVQAYFRAIAEQASENDIHAGER